MTYTPYLDRPRDGAPDAWDCWLFELTEQDRMWDGLAAELWDIAHIGHRPFRARSARLASLNDHFTDDDQTEVEYQSLRNLEMRERCERIIFTEFTDLLRFECLTPDGTAIDEVALTELLSTLVGEPVLAWTEEP